MPRQQPIRATPADHVHVADETCPYCEQPISNDRAVEIRARFDADARAKTAAIQDRYDQQLTAKVTELRRSENPRSRSSRGQRPGASAAQGRWRRAAAARARAGQERRRSRVARKNRGSDGRSRSCQAKERAGRTAAPRTRRADHNIKGATRNDDQGADRRSARGLRKATNRKNK